MMGRGRFLSGLMALAVAWTILSLPALALEGKICLLDDLEDIYLKPPEISEAQALPVLVAGGLVLLMDAQLFKDIRGTREAGRDPLSSAVSYLGDARVDLGLCALLATRDPKTAYLGANAVIYSGIVTQFLKVALGRTRPYAGEGDFSGPNLTPGYDSFPSGHTASAFALATLLSKRYPRYSSLFYAGAMACALARVGNSAHWPGDTVFGAAIGIWSAEHVIKSSRLFGPDE